MCLLSHFISRKRVSMTIRFFVFLSITLSFSAGVFSQELIPLPYDKTDQISWVGDEKAYFSSIWQTEVVTNVSVPTMTLFRAKKGTANGTAVIIAPGGGLYGLSIKSEGDDVARWLSEKGITAFVLRYRLVPTGEDGVKELGQVGKKVIENVAPVLPLSIADGLAAVDYVRSHSEALGVDKNKIGFMGFSAGGAVAMGVTLNYRVENRPDFIVPVYPWMTVLGDYQVPSDAPPMLVICASDDPLKLASESISLYQKWLDAGKSVGMHMYSKGGHGFGMRKKGLASDHWIERFYDWSQSEGIVSRLADQQG